MKEEAIEQLVALELESAESKFLKHNSAHESFAILKEEFDEVEDKFDFISEEMDGLWVFVKKNDTDKMKSCVDQIRETAVKLIEESIQVVAMCDRFKKDVLECPF